MTRRGACDKKLITVADDFGLSPLVNQAVEQAARDGILTSASLMVGAPFAADAVARARSLGGQLKVGLHLVVVQGAPISDADIISDLLTDAGEFPSDQVTMGFRYAFSPRVRRQLAAEIRAQFAAFAATGLELDHANSHKHMHLHPVVGAMMLDIGKAFGLRAVRVPAEPAIPGVAGGFGGRALYEWSRLFRWQARRAGMRTNDFMLGLAASGHMGPALVQGLLDRLPAGVTEMYFHPAIGRDEILARHMPDYEHANEFAALMQSRIPADASLTTYSALA
jgi:hopanoid biosynthesis associated protein HpnK